jgi:hypothetical protein
MAECELNVKCAIFGSGIRRTRPDSALKRLKTRTADVGAVFEVGVLAPSQILLIADVAVRSDEYIESSGFCSIEKFAVS